MKKLTIPFNIRLLSDKDIDPRVTPQVTDLSIFDSTKEVFHPDGLFSDRIFGPVGSEVRYHRFAYIDVKLPVLHPIIYRALNQARKFYISIMNGTAYAKFSNKDRDFIKSDPIEGETGIHFFMQHFSDLILEDTGTDRRNQTINLLKKFKDSTSISKIIVLPAGLRDVEFEEGRPTYDEVNQFYKRLIALSNNISPTIIELDPSLVDEARFKIQTTVVELYENLSERIEGKKKLFLGKWASRRIFNGTRNVITSLSPSGRYLNDRNNPGYNDTVVGLYQMMKAILPVAIYHIQGSILRDIFVDVNHPAQLINKETWQLEDVMVDTKVFDQFQSAEGIEKLITEYQHDAMKHEAVSVGNHYVALTYIGPDDTFRIFRDINELPEGRSREDVHPTTYTELFYSAMYTILHDYPSVIVRYPITGPESTVPATVFVKTTVRDEKRYELDSNFIKTENIAPSWPILNESCMASMAPPASALAGLGGDFDGDTMSFNVFYSEEAKDEIISYLQTRNAYVTPMGKMIKSPGYDTVNFVCRNLSADPISA